MKTNNVCAIELHISKDTTLERQLFIGKGVILTTLLILLVSTMKLSAQLSNELVVVNAENLSFVANSNTTTASFGTAIVDINGDGSDEVIVTRPGATDLIYQTESANLIMQTNTITRANYPSSGLTWGDYDNDADLDLFVSTQGATNHLFGNNLNGKFDENTSYSTITEQTVQSNHASWVDYDNDGWLDLFVGNTSSYTAGGGLENELYHNDGGKGFTKIEEGEIVTDKQNTLCGNWGDYDNDGDQDLFSVGLGGDNYLYINNGDGTFTKSQDATIANNTAMSISCSWIDYNNDGNLDLFVGNGGFRSDKNFLFKNNGDGTFTSIEEGDIVNLVADTWNGLWGDLDNDGDLDLVDIPISSNVYVHLNNNDGSFTSINIGHDLTGMCSGALSDMDNDGDLDVYLADAMPKVGNTVLFNEGNSNHWLQVAFKGITGSGIGARIRIKATINGKAVWQMREIAGNTAFRSQNSMVQHFGLGDAEVIDSLVFVLPSQNMEVIQTNIDADQLITIEEPLPEGYLLPRFVADSLEGIASLTVSFTDKSLVDNSTPITSWAWDFDGDGVTDSEEQNPEYTYTSIEDALYDVSLTISNGITEETYSIENCIQLLASEYINLAIDKRVYSSSNENKRTPAKNAVDGSSITRWASSFSDPQWIMIAFDEEIEFGGILLEWEAAYAEEFGVYISSDSVNWTEMYKTSEGAGGLTKLSFDAVKARYVMMYGTKRSTVYGYSLYEFGVFDRMPFGKTTEAGEVKVFFNTSGSANLVNNAEVVIYPNPVNSNLNISYVLQSDTMVQLDVFDAGGAYMGKLIHEYQLAGEYKKGLQLNSSYKSGAYFYTLKTNNEIYSGMFLKK